VAVDLARYFLGSPVAAFALVFAGQAALFLIAAGLAAKVGRSSAVRVRMEMQVSP
jgi:BCD family chlorophyll transporter-like MFS transporter